MAMGTTPSIQNFCHSMESVPLWSTLSGRKQLSGCLTVISTPNKRRYNSPLVLSLKILQIGGMRSGCVGIFMVNDLSTPGMRDRDAEEKTLLKPQRRASCGNGQDHVSFLTLERVNS